MASQSDRVVIKFGPGRLDADKAIQREVDTLRDEIDTKQTTVDLTDYPTFDEVEDIVTDVVSTINVTGAIPSFTGVPAGLQQFYNAPVVLEDTINLTDTVRIYDDFALAANVNPAFQEDTGNTFGAGIKALVTIEDSLNSAAIYNFNTGTAAIRALGGTVGSIRVGPNFSVAFIPGSTTTFTPTIRIVQSGSVSSVTLLQYAADYYFLSAGVSEDGSQVCAMWYNATLDSFAVAFYDPGSNTPANSFLLPAFDAASTGLAHPVIDNGWIVFSASNTATTNTLLYTVKAKYPIDISSFKLLLDLTSLDLLFSATSRSNNVTDDNHIYVAGLNTGVSSYDLFRINLDTGVVSVYPEVFRRYYESSPGVQSVWANITLRSLRAISSTKLVFGGEYQYIAGPDAGIFFPVYSSVEISVDGANVSDSLLTAYASLSAGAAAVFAMTHDTDGNVVYAIKTPTPEDDYLLKVAGP